MGRPKKPLDPLHIPLKIDMAKYMLKKPLATRKQIYEAFLMNTEELKKLVYSELNRLSRYELEKIAKISQEEALKKVRVEVKEEVRQEGASSLVYTTQLPTGVNTWNMD